MLAPCPLAAESVDPAEFQALREEWNELVRDSNTDCLFLTWEWLHTWWKHLAGRRSLTILALREDGRLLGLAPLAQRPPELSNGHPFAVREFLGSGYVGSDYLDVIARKGAEKVVLDSLIPRLASEQCVYKLANMASDSQVAQTAPQWSGAGWNYQSTATNVCPYISLSGKTWEAYLSELGSEHRYNYRRRLRQLDRDFTVTFEAAGSRAECLEAIDTVIELHNLRRSHIGGSDAFHTPELIAFHREFAGLAFERGWLRLYVLRLNGKPVGCLYGFLYGGKFYYYQSGFDPAFEKYSPGMILFGLSIQAAIEEGATEFDLLHGDEPYKSRWTSLRRDLTRIELFPPGLMGRFFQVSVEMIRKHRRVARGVQRNSQ